MRRENSLSEASKRYLSRIGKIVKSAELQRAKLILNRLSLEHENEKLSREIEDIQISPPQIVHASKTLLSIWRHFTQKREAEALKLHDKIKKISEQMRRLERDVAKTDELIASITKSKNSWRATHERLNKHAGRIPKKRQTELANLVKRVLLRRNLEGSQISEVTTSLVGLVDEALKVRLVINSPTVLEKRKREKPKRLPQPEIAPEDIFLPIPNELRPYPPTKFGLSLWNPHHGDYELGGFALGERSVGKISPQYRGYYLDNVSKYYVPKGAPLGPANRFLPLAYREKPYLFGFYRDADFASGFNVHKAFDKETWDHIKSMNRAKSGSRCQLCGKVSLQLTEILPYRGRNRIFVVESHEVWSWHVPDQDIPVGIQKLERILVCCYRCHMTFHETQFIREIDRANARGEVFDKEGLLDELMEHRSFLTRLSVEDVKEYMDYLERQTASHKHISNWVIDLSNLAKQDYAVQLIPHLKADGQRDGRITPDHIAGISFFDQAGNLFHAKTATESYELVSQKYRTDFDVGSSLITSNGR